MAFETPSFLRFLTVSLITICSLYLRADAVTVTIDEDTEFQTIDGFGGSIMMWISENKDEDWARYCAQEIGVSIVRCDLHPEIIGKFDNEQHFVDDITTNMGFMNSSASEIDIGFTAAKNFHENRLDEMKIMVSVWTQPHWMKVGAEDCRPDEWNRYTMGGTLPHTDEGREQNARYLTAALKLIENDYDITIYGISPQNELDWWHACETYTESCKKYYSGDEEGPGYCTWIPETKRLREELDTRGLDHVKIIGPEHGTFGPGEWNAWQQMKYVRDIYNDPEMLDILDVWAVHSYGVPNSPDPLGRTNWSWLWDGYNGENPELKWKGYKEFGKPNWQTECEAGDNTWDGGAMVLANRIQDALIAGHASAFIPWAMGTPDPGKYEVTSTTPPYSLPKTAAFRHFSRYVRPGAVRLEAGPDDPTGVTVSAFRHKAHGTITIVLINNGSAATADITLPAFTNDIASFDVFTSTPEASWQQTSVSPIDGDISIDVPESGIVTIYGQGTATTGQNRSLPVVLHANEAATRHGVFITTGTFSNSKISKSTRFYSLRGEYIGTLGDMQSGDHRSISQGMYILRHLTDMKK